MPFTRSGSPITCATDGRHKLVRFGDRDLLYDLAIDPLELDPQAPDGQEPVARLRRALEAPALWVRPATAPDPGAGGAGDADDIERRMKLLGYM